jgi:hypothetical protein
MSVGPQVVNIQSANRALKIDDGTFSKYNWTIDGTIAYNDILNYERAGKKQPRHCVMCGLMEDGENCTIPNQNKDVCRVCDSTYWFLEEVNVIVKFCKGCKTFFPLMNYDDKPEASKCGSCRQRGRDNYYYKKENKVNKRSHALKKMRQDTLSPEEFCTLVNTMTDKDDEGIDIETLLEYASNDDCNLEYLGSDEEPPFVISNFEQPPPPPTSARLDDLFVDDDDLVEEEDDEDMEMEVVSSNRLDDLFVDDDDYVEDDEDDDMDVVFMWLPELVISPPPPMTM